MPNEGHDYQETAQRGSRSRSLAFHYVWVRLVTVQGVKEDHSSLSTITIGHFLVYLKAMSLCLIKHRAWKSHEKL
jgi:hypothetical protein